MKDLNYRFWARHRTPTHIEAIENRHNAISSILSQDAKREKLELAISEIAPVILDYCYNDTVPSEQELDAILRDDKRVFSTIRDDAYAFCESALDISFNDKYKKKEEAQEEQALELWYYLFANYLNTCTEKVSPVVLSWAQEHWHIEFFENLTVTDEVIKDIVQGADGDALLKKYNRRLDVDYILENHKDDSFESWERLSHTYDYVDIPEDVAYLSFYLAVQNRNAELAVLFKNLKYACFQDMLIFHSCSVSKVEELLHDRNIVKNKIQTLVLLEAWYREVKKEYSQLLLYKDVEDKRDSWKAGMSELTTEIESLKDRIDKVMSSLSDTAFDGNKDLYKWYFSRSHYLDSAPDSIDKQAETIIRSTIEGCMLKGMKVNDIYCDIHKAEYLQFISSDYTKLEELGEGAYANLYAAYNSFIFSDNYYLTLSLDSLSVSLFRGFALSFWKQRGNYVDRAKELLEQVFVPYEGWKLRFGGDSYRTMNREAFVLSALIMMQERDELSTGTLSELRSLVLDRLFLQVHACWFDTIDSTYLVPLQLAEILTAQFETGSVLKEFELKVLDNIDNLEWIALILQLNSIGLSEEVKNRLSDLWSDQSLVLKLKYDQMHKSSDYMHVRKAIEGLIEEHA